MKTIVAILAVMSLVGSVNTAFAFTGGYVGVSAGQSAVKDACDGLDNLNGVTFSGSCDDTDTAWKIFGGYQFSRNWGIELGYYDNGEVTLDGTGQGGGVSVPVNAKAESSGFALSGVGTYYFTDKFGLFGKLGIVYWDIESSATATGAAGPATVNIDDDGTALGAGIGLVFKVSERVGIRGEWERTFDAGDANTVGESDVDFLSLGVAFYF